jgi:hypothetical protein
MDKRFASFDLPKLPCQEFVKSVKTKTAGATNCSGGFFAASYRRDTALTMALTHR